MGPEPPLEFHRRRRAAAQVAGERGQVFVGNIILLAHTLELGAVAEGIETADQLELLKAMHCDGGQGFHLGAPSVPDRISETLDEQRVERARRLSENEPSQWLRG